MSPPAEPGPEPRAPPRLPGGLMLLLVAVAFGALSAIGLVAGIILAAGTVAVALFLRRVEDRSARTVALVLPLAVLGELCLTAPISLVTELLAGAMGLMYLAWLAEDAPAAPAAARNLIDELTLPALAIGVAVAVSLIVPVSGLLVGATAAILGGLLLYVGWLFGKPRAFQTPTTGS
jgi:hypothetical protein